ncbi:hypothetical protein P8452_15521 [Trifolium repens]|nr:hypothetical protein P8452_15521 [Trifolium repens]
MMVELDLLWDQPSWWSKWFKTNDLDIDQFPLIPDRSGRAFGFPVGQISFGNIASEFQSRKRQNLLATT